MGAAAAEAHSPVRAGGGVVWRIGAHGQVEVLVVHRPRYDDWTLPKGKVDDGESDLQAAVREVAEEAGLHCEPGAELPTVCYVDHHGRAKQVRYWTMTVLSGAFRPNDEVDEVRWLPVDEAATALTYAHDRPVLAAVDVVP
ncbi:hypothetical protein BH23ACT2_BH23ACT2_16950 [soil metagenome]